MLTGFMVLMIVVSNAAGDVLITRGMKEIGDISAVSPLQFLRVVKSILCNRNFLGGVFCLAVSFFSFLIVLSWADLSFVVPATAIVYVVSILGAKFILKENINSMRWAGTMLVCLGVALVCIP
jgi:transporter family protein